VCTKVCEKKVRELISEPGAKLPKSFVKMKTQKLIESQNMLCYRIADDVMVRALDATKQHFLALNG
jgi:hypothetical protein